jgi:glyoxylase-like metal-dependent hydrolase (beta-lactamase superfamily II)
MKANGKWSTSMKVLKPYPHILAFYDGRVEGVRAYSQAPNWLDDGAYTLGVCSYAIVDGAEALVYDTHISLEHAKFIRNFLENQGVTSIRVVLSHWHNDHIAGNEVFQDCEIISTTLTHAALTEHRQKIENAEPPINPLIMPNKTFQDTLTLKVGEVLVELRHVDIHSYDTTVLLLPEMGLFLAADALEDPITYVVEPSRLQTHLNDLQRISAWKFQHILPSHGAVDVIESGGYDSRFIKATQLYVEKLLRVRAEPELAQQDLQTFAKEAFETGGIIYFAAYEPVHRKNIQTVLA